MQTINRAFVLLQTRPDVVAAELDRARAAAESSPSDEADQHVAHLEALDAAHAGGDTHPLRDAIARSVEVGVIVPSILRTNLEGAGFKVLDDVASLSEYGFASMKTLKRVIVRDKAGTMVAMGAAGDVAEALLAAVLNWCRENPLAGSQVPAGMGTAPTVPSPANPN